MFKATNESPEARDYGKQTEEVEAENQFLITYMGLSAAIREMIGHSFETFIQECTFRGATCLSAG